MFNAKKTSLTAGITTNMTITAKVIAHSTHPGCPDIITMELSYNRFIHAEFMTHREFSRNASSSRAIPAARQLQMILDDTAKPEVWGSNKPGMQAGAELTGMKLWAAKKLWGMAARINVGLARAMNRLGVHKQIVNRICEPYAHIKVVVTSTNWSNFLALRDHPDAQPEIAILARAIRSALEAPHEILKLTQYGWHLPYVTDADFQLINNYILHVNEHGGSTVTDTPLTIALRISVARCARVSYFVFGDSNMLPTVESDLALYFKLVGGYPLHASPAEHQASPIPPLFQKANGGVDVTGNLRGWKQYRKTLIGESVLDPEQWKQDKFTNFAHNPAE